MSDLSCVRWLVLMYHTDGNAANTVGLQKKGGAFTPIFKNDRSSLVFQNWSGTNERTLPSPPRFLFLSFSVHAPVIALFTSLSFFPF